MKIVRETLPTVDHFTIAPNAWIRDVRLSRKARGILVELLSHQDGWEASVLALSQLGPEGRDSIRSAIFELEKHGYLERRQSFDATGKFTKGTYVLRDPHTQPGTFGESAIISDDSSISAGGTVDGLADGGSPLSGYPTAGNPSHKKTIFKKTKTHGSSRDEPSNRGGYTSDFEEFWSAYPKREGPNPKKPAFTAWKTAIKKTSPKALIAASKSYASSELPDNRRMIPQATTWLNQERWSEHDEPPVDDWLRLCWQTGDTAAIQERTGLIYPGVMWPDEIPDTQVERDQIKLAQARLWIELVHDDIIGRLANAA